MLLRDPGGIGAADLAATSRAHLADNEVPRRFVVLDSLPKSPMGKVLKTDLRALWAGEAFQPVP